MLTREELEQWKKEHDEIIARLDSGDYSILEEWKDLWVEVPEYVIEWWVDMPEPLNGRKDVAYCIYGYDTPPEVKEWIDNQSSVLTALYHVERAIQERKEREEIRKMLGW